MDMAEISTANKPTVTDAAAITSLLHTATSGQDAATSESRLVITSENTDKHNSQPITISQNHISTILESNTSDLNEKNTTAGHSDHVTFGNNHSSFSSQMCKTLSGGANAQNWDSSTLSKDITMNADSTASANIYGKGYISSISFEDSTTSPNKETVVVSENITTMAGDPYTASINMATNEDTVAAVSGVHFISTTNLGDICSANDSEEAIPDPGVITNIFSGEKIAGSVDTFSAVSTGDATSTAPSRGSILVFVDTNDIQAASSPVEGTTTEDDVPIVPGDFTASPISDSGEISLNTFKKASTSVSEDTSVLLQGGTAGMFITDTSAIFPTFSTTTEYINSDQSLPVISGSTSGLPCNISNTAVEDTHMTGGPRGSLTNGDKTGTIFREANTSISAVPTTTPGDACKASTEGLDFCRNITFTTSLETTGCTVTTESGNTSVITGKNATAFGNITTHLDTATINEPLLVILGNVTNTADIRSTTTLTPRNTGSTTASMTQRDASTTHEGETSTILSSASSIKTAHHIEEAIADSDGPTIEPNSIMVSGNPNATVCIAITDVVDHTAREDAMATPPEYTDKMESSSSPQNGAIIIAGENGNTTLKKSSGDGTTKPPFGGSNANPVTVGTGTKVTQGYTFTSPAGNATVSCGSTVVSEGSAGDKATSTSFGGSAIPGNDTGMMHRENNSSIFDDASIAASSREIFTVSQDTTLNTATTILSQTASVYSAKAQVGQYSETITRKTSTVFGNSTNTHRDMDTIEVILPSPTNTVITAATSTINILENGNTATSRRPTPTSQNMNDIISEEVTTSAMSEDGTECMTSRNMAAIHFENAVTTAATFVSSGEFESTNITSLAPRETTCPTGNDRKKTSSGSTLSFCVPAAVTEELSAPAPEETPISIGKPIPEFTSMHGDTPNEVVSPDSPSAHNIVQDRKLNVATIADDRKTPSDINMAAPEDISTGPASIVSVLSREINTSALEDVANNTSDSASINATSSGDTSEDAHYYGRITSGHNGTQTILGCVSTPDSSFSVRTNFQEASKGLRDTTIDFGYTINVLEGIQICHEFASVHSKIPTALVQTPKFNDTAIILGGCICTEATGQSKSAPTANAASTSVDDKNHSETPNTPVTTGSKNNTSHKDTEILNRSLIPDSISSSGFSGIFEATPIPKENRYITAITDANSDAAIITSTKSEEATAAEATGDFMKTTTLLKDTTTFTITSTGATATVTVLKDAVMSTQTSMGDIATVSRNKTTTILEDTSTLRETVTSEKIAASTLRDFMTHSEVLIPGTRTGVGTPESNITSKETLGNDPSDYYLGRITTDSLATDNITNILSDTISTPNNANTMLEITTSTEGILTSRNNCTATLVGISIQSQTPIPEAPSIVTEASFATAENITIITTSEARIAHPVLKDATMINTPEDETNSDITINSSENIINNTVSPREVGAATCIPIDPTSSAFGKTMPSGQRFDSGNAANTSTSLEEVCAHPDYTSPTEAFSTLVSTSHGDTRQLVELVTPCLSTISISENTSRTSETSTGFGNATAPIFFLQVTDQSTATGDTTTSITTTGIAAFADPKDITTAPGDTYTFVRTTPDESGQSVATSTPEHIPTTFGGTVTYTEGKATGTDVAKCVITTMRVSEGTITAPGGNNTDLAVPRDKNTVSAVGSVHSRTSTAYGDAIDADRVTTSGPITYKTDASTIPTCPVRISLMETLTPSAITTSEDTDTLPATPVVGKPPTTATTVASGKYPEATMVVEETAVSGIITIPRETFVPKISTSFTEAPIPRSATTFSLASSSEAAIFPAETSTDEATFFTGQTAVYRNTSCHKSTDDEDITVVTTSCSTSSFVNTPFTPCNIGREALVLENSVCSAAGHPHNSTNTTCLTKNVASTVPEDTTIVSGNNCTVSEGPATITLGKGTNSPTKKTPITTEGDFIIATGMIHTAKPRDTNDTTTTESSVTAPRRTTVVPVRTPVIAPGEKTTVTYTTTETAKITGGISDETGKIITATLRDTNIATFGKAVDSTTRVSFVASGKTLAISPRETPAATFGEITSTTCTSTSQTSEVSHEEASTTPEETLIGISRETATVQLGKATETITRETPTIIHRKISTTVPQKTFIIANSTASSALAPGETSPTAFAEVMHKASPLSVLRNDKPIAVASEDTCMAAPSKITSASQEKNWTLKPVTPLPYWSIMLIGITVIVFLVAGFCMVIYYVTFLILVAYSASRSSDS